MTWVKVKGHADNEFNNRCDKLAVTYTAMIKDGTAPFTDGTPVIAENV